VNDPTVKRKKIDAKIWKSKKKGKKGIHLLS
jgi:hypothetical protein